MSFYARYPVILLAGHWVTALITDSYQRHGAHCNTNLSINEMQKKFIYLRIRREMDKMIARWQHYILLRTRPLCLEMATCRVAVRTLSSTSVNTFGPLSVANGLRREKRWGLTTRTVYLDLIPSLSADSCTRALDSLATRHGPSLDYGSENGSTSVAASKIYVDPDGQRPQWIINVPHAPHTGGAWERLIGLTKRVLENLRMDKTPTEERLRWYLARAEYIINSRSLTESSASATSTEVAITPNVRLLGHSTGSTREAVEQDINLDYVTIRDAGVQRFWKRQGG